MRSPLLPAFLFFLGLAGGCEDLSARIVGACGNQVVEDDHEDCDTFGKKDVSAVCLPPNDPNACRFTCENRATKKIEYQCPPGWTCGKDTICRRPNRTLEPLVSPIAADAQSLRLGDFDGDTNLDVLAVGSAGLTIFYFERNGVLGGTLTLPNAGDTPAVGDLSSDKAADLALPTMTGLGVLRGQRSRTINPATYSRATVEIGEGVDRARFIAIDALSEDAVGDEIVLMYSPTGASQTVRLIGGSRQPGKPFASTPMFDLPPQTLSGQGKDKTALDLLRGELPVGDLKTNDPDNQCEEFVVGFSGQSTINVYSPCTPGGDGFATDSTTAFVSTVTLPSDQTLAGRVFLVDVNGDKRLDLVFGSQSSGGMCGVRVAYGLPDGTFHADANSLPVPPANGDGLTTELKAFTTKCEKASSLVLLAVGDINRDKCLDVVTAGEILLSTSGDCTGELTRTQAGTASFWTDARIADFNANGLLDVVAVAVGSRNVDFYNATPDGKLNPFTIPTPREVKQMIVGDFDGDLVTDLAFNEGVQGSPEGSISIAFGRLAGAPESPVNVDVYPSVSQLVAGDIRPFSSDAISDLLVVSSDSSPPSTYPLSLLAGSSSRQMLAPLVITDPSETVLQVPRLAAIGDFAGDDPHPDVAVLTVEVKEEMEGGQPQEGSRVGLVMIPAKGDAEFDLNAQVSLSAGSGLPGTSAAFELLFAGMKDDGFFSVNLHAANLGSGTGDDLILSTSPSGDPRETGGALTVLKVQENQWTILSGTTLGPGEYHRNGVRSADINGDGKIDLAGILVNGGNIKSEGFKKQLDVFWNGGWNGTTFNFTRTSFSLEGEDIDDFVFMDLDESDGTEIVLATDKGIILAKPKKLEGDQWILEELKTFEGIPASALAAGDITGDGLDDLVIAQGSSVVFYRGKPELE